VGDWGEAEEYSARDVDGGGAWPRWSGRAAPAPVSTGVGIRSAGRKTTADDHAGRGLLTVSARLSGGHERPAQGPPARSRRPTLEVASGEGADHKAVVQLSAPQVGEQRFGRCRSAQVWASRQSGGNRRRHWKRQLFLALEGRRSRGGGSVVLGCRTPGLRQHRPHVGLWGGGGALHRDAGDLPALSGRRGRDRDSRASAARSEASPSQRSFRSRRWRLPCQCFKLGRHLFWSDRSPVSRISPTTSLER
jgi:hypothetical protein